MALGDLKIYRKIASFKMYLQPNFFNAIKVCYFDSPNFGDALNPILLKFLGVKNIANVATEFYHGDHLICIGSMIQVANKHSIIWGSGIIGEKVGFHYSPPKKIVAVRGPKTRQRMLALNVACPEVYGDPALLMPIFHPSKKSKKYKYGIIPHYLNKDDVWLKNLENNKDIKIINVLNYNALEVIDEINQCGIILSSSLHGIIIADAYKIPSYWIKFSKKIGPDDFKFYDYYESVNIFEAKAYNTIDYTFEDIIKNDSYSGFKFNALPLLNAFPYPIAEDVLLRAEEYYKTY